MKSLHKQCNEKLEQIVNEYTAAQGMAKFNEKAAKLFGEFVFESNKIMNEYKQVQ